ncbi:MAG: DUF2878 domain-containing protein [Gammaproteobacteria bacterium]|nr:DUF2878 domain-containing protein [Gammaproteobacteria bacterium]
MKFKLFNFLAFQVGWLIGCIGASQGWPGLGPVYTTAWLTVHLVLVGAYARQEFIIVIAAAVLGYLADSALVLLDIFEFPPQAQFGQPTTLWMVSLWANLALTLRHCLGWLRNRFVTASLLGAIAGPLAYAAGGKLGAITLDVSASTIIAIGIEWSLTLPLLLLIVKAVEGPLERPAGTSKDLRTC